MTPREQALVDGYEIESKKPLGNGQKRLPVYGAGWFIKHHGSAKKALAAWRASARRIAGMTDEANAWLTEAERLLRQAAGEELS